ncbi:MAG: hypothetical protein PHH16_01570 [Candidatus Gracilibacteria bacterium]|nr:hypothetical protein [Candidatus Gracilibacteria bacterium]
MKKHSFTTIMVGCIFMVGSIAPSIYADTTADNNLSNVLGILDSANPYASALSSDVRAKLDAFMGKVQSKKLSMDSASYTTLLTTIKGKLTTLQTDPQYINNTMIQNVLGYILYEVNNLSLSSSNTSSSTRSASILSASPDNTDLCAQQGLNNIDELNWEGKRGDHVFRRGQFTDWDIRGYAYKMNAGESYSFPIRTDIPYFELANDYNSGFSHIYNISEKKCDFTNIKQTDGGCSGFVGWMDSGIKISVNAKFANPNWQPPANQFAPVADPSEHGYGCRLVPGKKYYLNVRWERKSDLVDASGNIRNDGTPLLSRERNNLRSKSAAELKEYLDGTFNGYGDSCMNGIGGHSCMIDYSFGTFAPGMDKWSPQQRADMTAKLEAVTAANHAAYQADLTQRAATETPANPYGLICPAGQRVIGASCH